MEATAGSGTGARAGAAPSPPLVLVLAMAAATSEFIEGDGAAPRAEARRGVVAVVGAGGSCCCSAVGEGEVGGMAHDDAQGRGAFVFVGTQ